MLCKQNKCIVFACLYFNKIIHKRGGLKPHSSTNKSPNPAYTAINAQKKQKYPAAWAHLTLHYPPANRKKAIVKIIKTNLTAQALFLKERIVKNKVNMPHKQLYNVLPTGVATNNGLENAKTSFKAVPSQKHP